MAHILTVFWLCVFACIAASASITPCSNFTSDEVCTNQTLFNCTWCNLTNLCINTSSTNCTKCETHFTQNLYNGIGGSCSWCPERVQCINTQTGHCNCSRMYTNTSCTTYPGC